VEKNMTKKVSHPEEIITQFRQMPPAMSATAHAIDWQESRERTAQDAVDDGSTEFDDELVSIIEACVRRGA
jgi:hypothetical protein